jgi:DNA polymerase III subunit epsilon
MNLADYTVASIDIESTGLDTAKDRIIQLGIVKQTRLKEGASFHPGALHHAKHDFRFNPMVPISKENAQIHGFTDESVKMHPQFAAMAENVVAVLSDAQVLVGYNLKTFDIPILIEELERAGLGGKFPPKDVIVLDAQIIYKQKEPRDLTAAVKKFCGREHKYAHSALADAEASLDVLQGQLVAYPDLATMTAKELSDWAGMGKLVDWAGCLERREDGEIVYTLKKVRGVRVKDDIGFAEWMLRTGFSSDTRAHLQSILTEIYAENGGQGE